MKNLIKYILEGAKDWQQRRTNRIVFNTESNPILTYHGSQYACEYELKAKEGERCTGNCETCRYSIPI